MFKIMTLATLANLSRQSQGGRLWIRKTPPSRNHNPESHNPENHNPETEHNRTQTTRRKLVLVSEGVQE